MKRDQGSWKLEAEDKSAMEILRDQGYSYTSIAELFDVCPETVRYWTNEVRQEKVKDTATIQAHNRTEEEIERRRIFMRNYMYQRYHSDPEFRRRIIELNSRNA